jgi:hypothetical protein
MSKETKYDHPHAPSQRRLFLKVLRREIIATCDITDMQPLGESTLRCKQKINIV